MKIALENHNIPQDLVDTILLRVESAQKHRARMQVYIQGTIALLSCIGIFFAYRFAAAEFRSSGFYQYFSIIFSDRDVVTTYWREFAVLLAESLPILGSAAILGTIVILVGSVRGLTRNVRVAFRHAA